MPTEMPREGDFQFVRDDLLPLGDEFGSGEVFLPDGLEGVMDSPMSNGHLHAIPWEYHVTTSGNVQVREDKLEVPIVIAGITILQREAEEADPVLYWRFVDWSAARAQLGVSSGRGEHVPNQDFVDLNGDSVDR